MKGLMAYLPPTPAKLKFLVENLVSIFLTPIWSASLELIP